MKVKYTHTNVTMTLFVQPRIASFQRFQRRCPRFVRTVSTDDPRHKLASVRCAEVSLPFRAQTFQVPQRFQDVSMSRYSRGTLSLGHSCETLLWVTLVGSSCGALFWDTRYYKVASSHLPAPQILHVLKLYYQVPSSHLPAPQVLRALKLYYKVAGSHLPARQLLRVLQLYYKVASSHLPAPQILRCIMFSSTCF